MSKKTIEACKKYLRSNPRCSSIAKLPERVAWNIKVSVAQAKALLKIIGVTYEELPDGGVLVRVP